jgi:hypothetical protein
LWNLDQYSNSYELFKFVLFSENRKMKTVFTVQAGPQPGWAGGEAGLAPEEPGIQPG